MYENLEEKKLESEKIFDGKIVHLYKDKILLPNGNTSYREHIVHQGAVAVVPITDDGMVYMERQFRYPFHKVIFEIPAGKIDPDEDPVVAAHRELKEETGLVNAELEFIGDLYPTVAYCNEVIKMYIARDFEKSEKELDEDEFLEVEKVHIDRLFEMVMNGEICDSKTQTAILKTYYIFHKK